jgi:hypothetical protein
LAKKPETAFKERIYPKLKRLPNSWFVKVQQMTIGGTPDFLMCVAGQFVALELKRSGGGKVAALQEYNLSLINQSGGIGLVVTPENWDVVYINLIKLAEGFAKDDLFKNRTN